MRNHFNSPARKIVWFYFSLLSRLKFSLTLVLPLWQQRMQYIYHSRVKSSFSKHSPFRKTIMQIVTLAGTPSCLYVMFTSPSNLRMQLFSHVCVKIVLSMAPLCNLAPVYSISRICIRICSWFYTYVWWYIVSVLPKRRIV